MLSVVSWRLIFFVNLPAGTGALLLLARVMPSPQHSVPSDWAAATVSILLRPAGNSSQ